MTICFRASNDVLYIIVDFGQVVSTKENNVKKIVFKTKKQLKCRKVMNQSSIIRILQETRTEREFASTGKKIPNYPMKRKKSHRFIPL